MKNIKYSFKYKAGFTLLELLVVVAIIGIFAAVAIYTLSGTRDSAKTAAFKSEMDALIPNLVSICHDRNILASDLAGGTSYVAFEDDPETQSCGVNGDAAFSIEVPSANGSACTTATLTADGASYSPSGC